MRKQPQQQRGRQAVKKIVQAGFVAVRTHGRADVTIPKIAAIAGVSPAAVYQYFAHKGEIFDAMDQAFVARVVAMIDRVEPEVIQLSVGESIRVLLGELSQLLAKDEGLYFEYMRQSVGSSQASLRSSIENRVVELAMKILIAHPELTQLRNLQTVGFIIINAGLGSLISYLGSDTPATSFEDLAMGLSTMANAYIAAEAPT